jgi:hypothetical protein
MFKMSMCGAALLLAGMVACSHHSGLNIAGGSTSGGQGTSGPGGSAGGSQTTGQNDCEKAGGTCEQGAPGACLGGWSPNTGGYSCASSTTSCCLPLSYSPCETAGGTCIQAQPGACPGGTVDNTSQYECSNMGGPSTCCMPSANGGASGTGGTSGDASRRTPLLHRAAGVACPTGRGPGLSICDCIGSVGRCLCAPGECGQDSNCTTGISGRCLMNGPAPITACSYDTCFSDSDCPAKTPCVCRSSASGSEPNSCLTGSDCRVDSDCGPGNFCSPSQYGQWCGFTYHCHTASDTCLDDSDCVGAGCNFNKQTGHWACGGDCGPAPP